MSCSYFCFFFWSGCRFLFFLSVTHIKPNSNKNKSSKKNIRTLPENATFTTMAKTKNAIPPPRPAKSRLRKVSSSSLLKHLNQQSSSMASQPPVIVLGDANQGDLQTHLGQLPPVELLNAPAYRRRTISVPTSSDRPKVNRSSIELHRPPIPSTSTDTQRPVSYFPPSLTRKPSSSASSTSSSSSAKNHRSSQNILPVRSQSTMTRKSNVSLTTSNEKPAAPQHQRRLSRVSLQRPPPSTIATTVARSAGAGRLSTMLALNRATVILERLARWHTFLKAVAHWLEDVSKQALLMARGYSSHRQLFQAELAPNQIPAVSTILTGLRMVTLQAADTQQAFADALVQTHLPAIIALKNQCKEMMRVLRTDPRLLVDELLRRAAHTKKAMDYLQKVCQDANADHPTCDPWLANLYVLRHLKREVEEENRLRALMAPIQRETALFEAKVLQCLKPAIRLVSEHLAPSVWDGSIDEEAAPFQMLMDRLMPDAEWDLFARQEAKELVDEDHVIKDYLNIYYPNKLHPKVVTLKTGTMERLIPGIRTRFAERAYVLTQGGFLHQFKPDDMQEPERSLYLPRSTIRNVDDCTLEIRLGSGKTYVIKASSTAVLAEWMPALSDMALGQLALQLPRPPRRLPDSVIIAAQSRTSLALSLSKSPAASTSSLPAQASQVSLSSAPQEKHLVTDEHQPQQDTAIEPLSPPTPPPSSLSQSTAEPAVDLLKPSEQQEDVSHLTLPTPSTSSSIQHSRPSSLSEQSGHIVQQDQAAMASYSSSSVALPIPTPSSSSTEPANQDGDAITNDSTDTILALPSSASRSSPALQPSVDTRAEDQWPAPSEPAEPIVSPSQYPPTLEQLQLQRQIHGEEGTVVDDDDSSSTFSGHSMSTVTTSRYSTLPTTSNQNYTTDPETSSIFTDYEDAVSHLSSHRLSTVSTQFDDAASSLYFSSQSTRASTLSFDSALSHDSLIDLQAEPLVIPHHD
ncbi:hypothetical protein DM01DRAFT_1403310 [Hesseltinella vesiculosa]|uniref:PH domain-containing protein n=1 Tax=Hesseltinella vesiculosa TaxID=101127 RepID=A0A1X2GXS4_9FUNG|nr:hypothetical protein DM01DRAFT_1403310 [Hesseltinella vesiculosa]